MDQLNRLINKIFTKESIQSQLAVWRFKGEKIVFSNGCFDILHRGHIEYLAQAADLGVRLIIGLNSDTSVRRIKGEERPLQDQVSRSVLLAALSFVDAVIVFDEDTPYELIKSIKPDFLVKGNDYKAEDIVGYDIVKENGGDIVTIKLVEGYSTTSIVSRMQK